MVFGKLHPFWDTPYFHDTLAASSQLLCLTSLFHQATDDGFPLELVSNGIGTVQDLRG